jgi:ribosome maturation factor RimP
MGADHRHGAVAATAPVAAVAARLEAQWTIAQVAGEEVVMHGNSRHGSPPPSRAASADAERIASLLQPTVAGIGMDLEDVRITSAGRRRLLRIVVDADGGVSLDDIALASQQLSAALDREEAMGEAAYTLEVSSPGVDRPLTQPKHWRRAAGRLVTAPLRTPSGPDGAGAAAESRMITGRVSAADTLSVRLDIGGEIREFGYAELGPGRIQVEFSPLPADDSAAGSADDGAGQGADEEGPDGH